MGWKFPVLRPVCMRLALLPALLSLGCRGEASTLATFGKSGTSEAILGWYLVLVALLVSVITWGLIAWAALRRRTRSDGTAGLPPGAVSGAVSGEERGAPGEDLVPATGSGLSWVMIGGIVVPAVILTATFLFTVFTLNAVAAPARPTAARIQVVGHQWWWEIHYRGASPNDVVVTANELHVPVGQPVRVELESDDVIHSFWVPEIAGKTDVIPGQHNVTWIEAKEPGVYWGHCGEYCGAQHANMAMRLVAESPAQFALWLASQRQPAAPPTDAVAAEGERVFLAVGCASCHTVRGTPARGRLGPDLTHVMTRITIGAGSFANTRGNRAGWVVDAQGMKPGVLMPTMAVGPDVLQPLLAYIETLR